MSSKQGYGVSVDTEDVNVAMGSTQPGIADDMEEDLAAMDDPTFLAERKRVREATEALIKRMAKLDNEFIRRAGISWASASRG